MTQLASETGRFLRVKSFAQGRKKRSRLGLMADRTPRLGRRGGWAVLALLAALVDGKVLVAGTVGLGVYQLASQDHEQLWQQLQVIGEKLKTQLSQGKNRAWLISGAAFMGSYGAIAASTQLGSAATLALLALGGVNLATLVMVTRHLKANHSGDALQHERLGNRAASTEPDHAEADHLDTHWRNLTASHPLKRFMAVRQLTEWGLASTPAELSNGGDRDYLVDCFHLMLAQEQEPSIRTALREALQRLAPTHLPQLGPGQAVLPTLSNKIQPVDLAVDLAPAIAQRQVDYVEP